MGCVLPVVSETNWPNEIVDGQTDGRTTPDGPVYDKLRRPPVTAELEKWSKLVDRSILDVQMFENEATLYSFISSAVTGGPRSLSYTGPSGVVCPSVCPSVSLSVFN